MGFFDSLPSIVKTFNDSKLLDYVVNYIKWMEENSDTEGEKKELRRAATETINRFATPGGQFYDDPRLFYVCLVVGRLSRNLGLKGVLEELHGRNEFLQLADFYITWAEIYAEEKDRNRFSKIWDLAVRNGAQPTSRVDEAFRAMLFQYFGQEEDEPTVNVFARGRNQGNWELRASCAVNSAGSCSTSAVVDGRDQRIPFASSCAPHDSAAIELQHEFKIPSAKTVAPTKSIFRSHHAGNILMVESEEKSPEELLAEFKQAEGADEVMDVCPDSTATQVSELPVVSEILQRPEETFVVPAVPSQGPRKPFASKPVPQVTSIVPRSRTPPPQRHDDIVMTSPQLGGTSFTQSFYSKAMRDFSDTVPVAPTRSALREAHSEETTVLNETYGVRPVAPLAPINFEVYVEEDGKDDAEGVEKKTHFNVFTDENCDPEANAREKKSAKDSLEITRDATGDLHKAEKPVNTSTGVFKKPEPVLLASPLPPAHVSNKFFGTQPPSAHPTAFNGSLFPDGADEEVVAGSESMHGKKVKGGPVTSTPANPFAPGIEEGINDFFQTRQAFQADVVFPATGAGTANSGEMTAFERRKSLSTTGKLPPPVLKLTQKAEGAAGHKPGSASEGLDVAVGRLSIGSENELNDDNEPTGCGLRSIIHSEINPWDNKVRERIMLERRLAPTYLHDFMEKRSRLLPGTSVIFGGEKFDVQALIGGGGFAKVYRCLSEDGNTYAVKYENPACRWEVYMCEALRVRLPKAMLPGIMTIRDAYMFTNASAIVYQYHKNGSLLDMVNAFTKRNAQCPGLLVVYLGWQMARIMKVVHEAKLIHGDVKPDNFMVTQNLTERCDASEILDENQFTLKLIDWGRGIDMASLSNRTFKGRAGTECFDCFEMQDGRPWTYQTDFFGYISTLHVLLFGQYMKTARNENGRYSMISVIKRRCNQRDILQDVFEMCMNIPDCESFPSWATIIKGFAESVRYSLTRDKMEWKTAAREFNAAICQ